MTPPAAPARCRFRAAVRRRSWNRRLGIAADSQAFAHVPRKSRTGLPITIVDFWNNGRQSKGPGLWDSTPHYPPTSGVIPILSAAIPVRSSDYYFADTKFAADSNWSSAVPFNRRPAILWQICSKQIRCPSRIAIAEERLSVSGCSTEEPTVQWRCRRAIIGIGVDLLRSAPPDSRR